MNGLWLGKNFSGLGDLMDIYNISNRRDVIDYLIYMIQIAKQSYAAERDRISKLQKK